MVPLPESRFEPMFPSDYWHYYFIHESLFIGPVGHSAPAILDKIQVLVMVVPE